MKPFDIELAKQGKPVCLRNGKKARIICFDRMGIYPVVALVQEEGIEMCRLYTKDGKCGEEANYDLMMAPERKTGWVNIYPYQSKEKMAIIGPYIYKTQKEAKENVNKYCIATVPIEWEE